MKLFLKRFFKIVILSVTFLVGSVKAYTQEVIVTEYKSGRTSGLESLLQGNVAGLEIKSWTGTAGSQSIINLRGLSLDPTDESTLPLIMVNGVPIIASPSEYTAINPLSYYSPEQVERIEVLKSIDLLAGYGVQAPNGAINIVTKQVRFML